jgi:hypothetical protein
MKRCLATTAVPRGWCLDVDIDEFFLFPYSEIMSLAQFLAYLNEHSYSAVLCQMLDMFSDQAVGDLAANIPVDDLMDTYRYYDLSHVTGIEYRSADMTRRFGPTNRVGSPRLRVLSGGVRKTLFGLNPLLSKHSLFRTDRGLQLFTHSHYSDGAHLADVSGLLLHYKLVANGYQSAAMNRGAFPATRKGYDALMDLIETQPDLRMRGPRARRFTGTPALLEENFLYASSRFTAVANAKRSG